MEGVLASEPVGGRSQATELPSLTLENIFNVILKQTIIDSVIINIYLYTDTRYRC